MRVISKEYQEMLDQSEAWNFIKNTPRPDFTELDKEVAEFAAWLTKEHEKDRARLRKWHEEEDK